MRKKILLIFIAFLAVLVLTSFNTSIGSSAPLIRDKVIDQKSIALISDAYGIDVSKYEMIVNASGTNDREFTAFGPGGVLQFGHYTLVNSESIVYINFEYVNGYLWYSTLTNIKGKPIYAPTVSADVINQSKNVLSNYQTFAAQNYASDTSYINTAKNMLSEVAELKTTNLTTSNAKLEIKNTEASVPITQNASDFIRYSVIKFYFSSNGIDYARKGLTLDFVNGSLRAFSDTWSLVSVGPPNILSKEEALNLAWATANNFNLSFIAQNGSIYQVKPDLTDATVDAHLSYTLRNSSELCPLWNIYIYFKEAIHGDYGIQIAIWGDNKEIMDCQPMTTLGNPDATPAATNPTNQITQNTTVCFIALGATVAIVAAALVVWKARVSKQKIALK